MNKRRCLACGRVHDTEVPTCNCGADMALGRSMHGGPPDGLSIVKGPRQGALRPLVLWIALVISVLGVVTALGMEVATFWYGQWLYCLVFIPLSAAYSMAMVYVFGDALEKR